MAADRVEAKTGDAAAFAFEDDQRLVDAERVAAAIGQRLRRRRRRARAFHRQDLAVGGDRHRCRAAAANTFVGAGERCQIAAEGRRRRFDPAENGVGSCARSPGPTGPAVFRSTTIERPLSGKYSTSERNPLMPPPCAIARRPPMSAMPTPKPYRVFVPSPSTAGVVIARYESALSTRPPCSAASHALRSDAVEQSEPAEYGQVWLM